MKLKTLFESPVMRTQNVYQRDDMSEPEYDEGPRDTKRTIDAPYTLGDGTPVTLKIEVTYQDYNSDIELHNAEPVGVVLPSGAEVEMDVARQQLQSGDYGDEFAEPEVFAAAQEFLEKESGSKVSHNVKAQFGKTAAPVGSVPAATQIPAKV